MRSGTKLKPVPRAAPKPPTRLSSSITADLERHAQDIGISVRDLRQICLRAGLSDLNQGGVKVKAKAGLPPRPDQRTLTLVLPVEVYFALSKKAKRLGATLEATAGLILTKAALQVELTPGDFEAIAEGVELAKRTRQSTAA